MDDLAIELINVRKSYLLPDLDSKNILLKKKNTHVVLDNINLAVRRGEIVGVLGHNGSGKSTLLSIISKIQTPDCGQININGKIVSILELGMGFHQDMTGIENIYLKGELYGLSKKQIDQIIDQIVDYSELGEYACMPVRTYSSGMSARLAFSIMIHLEADIYIIDEVLSVGDIVFSIKAQEHFKQLSTKGKTIIVVSHQISLLETLCTKVIWIESGKIFREGSSKIVCAEYRNISSESIEILMKLCAFEIPEAQYKLAIKYRDGIEIEKNNTQYEELIQKSASREYPKAMLEFGDILFNRGELKLAQSYYYAAAKKGDKDAKNRLANIEFSSEFIEEITKILKSTFDVEDVVSRHKYAEYLLKISTTDKTRKDCFAKFVWCSDLGYAPSIHQVALMTRDGQGTKRDLPKMEELLTKNANHNYLPSITLLADIYYEGKLLPQNVPRAIELYTQAANLGHTNSMYRLSSIYRDGVEVDSNIALSKKYLDQYAESNMNSIYPVVIDCLKTNPLCSKLSLEQILLKAVQSMNPSAISNLINYYIINSKDNSNLIALLEHLSESGNTEACKRLGNMYYDGQGVTRDFQTAFFWYNKSATLGDNWSKMRVADMLKEGKGVDQNLDGAIILYTDLAKLSNLNALSALISISAHNTIYRDIFNKSFASLISIGESGNADACKRLGNYYNEGIFVEKDYSLAYKWYVKSAKLGDNQSKNKIIELMRENKCCVDSDIFPLLNLF